MPACICFCWAPFLQTSFERSCCSPTCPCFHCCTAPTTNHAQPCPAAAPPLFALNAALSQTKVKSPIASCAQPPITYLVPPPVVLGSECPPLLGLTLLYSTSILQHGMPRRSLSCIPLSCPPTSQCMIVPDAPQPPAAIMPPLCSPTIVLSNQLSRAFVNEFK